MLDMSVPVSGGLILIAIARYKTLVVIVSTISLATWSLYSTHPSLENFYSGDKTNLVCKVDVERCADVSEGECVAICQEPGERSVSNDISKIVVLNDNVLWTASGSSSIRRWKAPLRRVISAEVDTIARTKSPTALKKRVTVQSTESLISVSPPTSTNRPESFLTVNSSLDKAKEIFYSDSRIS